MSHFTSGDQVNANRLLLVHFLYVPSWEDSEWDVVTTIASQRSNRPGDQLQACEGVSGSEWECGSVRSEGVWGVRECEGVAIWKDNQCFCYFEKKKGEKISNQPHLSPEVHVQQQVLCNKTNSLVYLLGHKARGNYEYPNSAMNNISYGSGLCEYTQESN